MFDEVVKVLCFIGGILSVDDSVFDKLYSYFVVLVGYFWFGKYYRVVKGINFIIFYYIDIVGCYMFVNYRIYDKFEDKIKNDYFCEMLIEVLVWGLKLVFVIGDFWYSCNINLKMIRNYQKGFMFVVEKNRIVLLEKGQWQQV